ncbi:MAG: hypothetical protein WA418_41590 [Bradyrhizobium sp.]
MADVNSTQTAKTPDPATWPAIAAAVVTAVGAYKLFEPKLERARAMRNEVGRLELSFRLLYQWPQYLLIAISTAIFLALVVAFVDSLRPGVLMSFSRMRILKMALAPENVIWVIFSLGIVGGVIYLNLLPRLLMGLTWSLSALPIPGLRNRFGPNGESLGWHQTAAVMEGPDKGAPLLIDDDAIGRVAWEVLSRLSKNTGAGDFATEPAKLSASEKANIALFGCIIEAVHYAQRWESPSWSEFYASFADIQRTKPMFGPQQLQLFANGQAFFEDFRDRLHDALKARNQPCPPDRALAAAADVSRTWELLQKQEFDVLRLVPPFAGLFGGPVAWLDHRLRSFPRLGDAGMRPQLIKLLVRWKAIEVQLGIFAQPFSKRQAWLLFQEGALRALPEVKEVTFHGTAQVPIVRTAVLRVIRRVELLIAEGASSEAQAVAQALGPSKWTRLERADFVLWSWAREAAKQAKAGNWDKAAWRWKFEDDRVQRQS